MGPFYPEKKTKVFSGLKMGPLYHLLILIDAECYRNCRQILFVSYHV